MVLQAYEQLSDSCFEKYKKDLIIEAHSVISIGKNCFKGAKMVTLKMESL